MIHAWLYESAVFQVIPAKGHANVVLSFTPYPTAEVPKDMDCIGYMLGYMSLLYFRLSQPKVMLMLY